MGSMIVKGSEIGLEKIIELEIANSFITISEIEKIDGAKESV